VSWLITGADEELWEELAAPAALVLREGCEGVDGLLSTSEQWDA
jgi:hypothetical protein